MKNYNYELAVVISAKIEDEERAAVLEKVTGYIARFGGTVTEVNEWGKKRLAYEINKVRDGYFTLIKFESSPKILEELNHIYRITEHILRGIIVKLEK